MCQLSQMTKEQLDKLTKEELVKLALDGVIIETITAREFDRETGELIMLKTSTADAYTREVIETREASRTFYETGPVDVITIKVTDSKGKTLQTDIKHDEKGKTPPVATTAAVAR